jgi:hypothetical protein
MGAVPGCIQRSLGLRRGSDESKPNQRIHRIDPDRQRIARWKRQKRAGDALPRQAQRVVAEGRDLIKEAKGLGRA